MTRKKEGSKVCVRVWGFVDYSHGKQKKDGHLFAADLILIARESNECV